ncbi:MAG: hypothetical protein ACKVJG_01185 [Candidatus Latescibacterota bacterium]
MGERSRSFTDLSVSTTSDAQPFVLSASAAGLSSANTASLTADIVATQMVFTTQPAHTGVSSGDVFSGVAFQTQPVIQAQNSAGVLDSHFADQITVATSSAGTLSDTTTMQAVGGAATFTNLVYTASADQESFTLTVNDEAGGSGGDLPSANASALTADIVATRLVFTTQPAHAGVSSGDVFSGVAFQTQPSIQAQDAGGQLDTHFTDQITLTTAAADTLSGTTTVQASSGAATFGNLAYTAAADQESFTLTANDEAGGSGGDLPTTNTNTLTADIVATQTVFATLPSDGGATNGDVVSGQAFTTQPILEAQNASGQRDLHLSGSATLSLASGGVNLFGTTSVSWSSGRADFSNSGLGASASGDGSTFALKAQTTGLPTRQQVRSQRISSPPRSSLPHPLLTQPQPMATSSPVRPLPLSPFAKHKMPADSAIYTCPARP